MLRESQISLVVFNLHTLLYSFLDRVHVNVQQAFVFSSIIVMFASIHSALVLMMVIDT